MIDPLSGSLRRRRRYRRAGADQRKQVGDDLRLPSAALGFVMLDPQIKSGAPAHAERVAMCNRPLEIGADSLLPYGLAL